MASPYEPPGAAINSPSTKADAELDYVLYARVWSREMNTRDEAVEYLKSRGLHAAERDWAVGETVFVATGRVRSGDVVGYTRAMYIVQKGGAWTSFELDRPRPEDDVQMSLSEACARVERILTALPEHPRDRRG
jgi:hypothetical protein